MAIRTAHLALIVLLQLAPLTMADVIVVDDDGAGADFTQISVAVENAHEGDTLLVKAGQYTAGPVVIDGKSLSIVAEQGAVVELAWGVDVLVRNLASSQTVALRGLTLLASPIGIDDCRGVVWLEDCSLRYGAIDDLGEVVVRDSDHVVLNRCQVEGRAGATFLGWVLPSPGLHASRSTLVLYDTEVLGGLGYGGPYGEDQDAETGVVVVGGFFFASGCTFRGGDARSKHGGDGFWMHSLEPQVRVLDTVFAGGPGHPPGQDLVIDSGSLQVLSGTARHLQVQAPTRVGTPMLLTFEGMPNDLVLIHHNLRPSSLYLPYLRGVLAIDPASLVTNAVGRIPGSGRLEVSVTTPSIGPQFEAIAFFTQASFHATNGERLLSSPALGVVLAPGF